MNKSNHFAGQPTFVQLLRLLPRDIIAGCISECNSDHYYKKFNTWHHLITMLFSCYGHCDSLREVVTGMRALEGRLQSTGMVHLPARSTFSQANAHRSSEVFEKIYFQIKAYFDRVFPDSRRDGLSIFLMDSSAITLFQEVFRGNGNPCFKGRKKGGLKVHMAVPLYDQNPCMVRITDGAVHDTNFTRYLNLPAKSTIIMDRGYKNYKQYNAWTRQEVRWVTRPWSSTRFECIALREVSSDQQQKGVKKDQHVRLGYPEKKSIFVNARIIDYKDIKTGKELQFLTNDLVSEPFIIAQLYQKRWGIELLFKRLKQNMPLHYFLGDNQNAIRIQIWCALIADLILNVIRRRVKRKWAFSNMVSLVRLHLFNYLDLMSFLENPERSRILSPPPLSEQLKLNLYG